MALSRRRLITAALAASASSARVRAADALLIASVNSSGGSWVATQLLTEIYRQAGLQLRVEVLPAPRASVMTLAGQLDGELIRIESYGQDRPQLLRVDPPFYRISIRAYSLADRAINVQSREDLQRYRLGAIRGMLYADDLVRNHPALTLTQSSAQMFRMLQAGRLDVVLSSTVAARSSIDKLQIKGAIASPELARFELYHYLHARRKDLAPKIADTIRKMKASGELERLIQQYEMAVAGAETE